MRQIIARTGSRIRAALVSLTDLTRDDRGSESSSKALWIAAIIAIALGAAAYLGPRIMEWFQAIPGP